MWCKEESNVSNPTVTCFSTLCNYMPGTDRYISPLLTCLKCNKVGMSESEGTDPVPYRCPCGGISHLTSSRSGGKEYLQHYSTNRVTALPPSTFPSPTSQVHKVVKELFQMAIRCHNPLPALPTARICLKQVGEVNWHHSLTANCSTVDQGRLNPDWSFLYVSE